MPDPDPTSPEPIYTEKDRANIITAAGGLPAECVKIEYQLWSLLESIAMNLCGLLNEVKEITPKDLREKYTAAIRYIENAAVKP